jgi:hypothetical protein
MPLAACLCLTSRWSRQLVSALQINILHKSTHPPRHFCKARLTLSYKFEAMVYMLLIIGNKS